MKKRSIRYRWKGTWGVITAILLLAAAMTACHVYQKTEIEEIRCPQVRDTILVPGWEETQ